MLEVNSREGSNPEKTAQRNHKEHRHGAVGSAIRETNPPTTK